jgi:glycyl-tRNA synthetase
MRRKLPFGIAQIGKAFRNEITPGNFIFRTREFEQMEMQYFVRPGTELQWYEYWKETRLKFHQALGIPAEDLKYHQHEKLAHYANAAVDIEYRFPFGFKEMEGIHSRTDFDLKSHQEFSKKKQQYFDNDLDDNGKAYGNYIPFVVETSVGADRLFLAILCNAFTQETIQDGDQTKERTYLNFHPAIAPVKVAICPIVKKDGLSELGNKIYKELKSEFMASYDEKDSIGKRYTRQDLIGTPYCVAIDYQTIEDQTVTVRHRNSTLQERVTIEQLKDMLRKTTSLSTLLQNM